MNTNRVARVIYPQPKQVTWQEGTLIIDRQVILNLPVNSSCDEFFAEIWENFTCNKTEIIVNTTAEQAENSFSLEVAGVPQLAVLAKNSTYALTVDIQGVSAIAADETGLRQAWFSMLQMLDPKPGTREVEGFQIPCVDIQDYPLLKFRSAHLCVFPETTLSALEKSINLFGMHKYTHVVIEFWGMLKLDTLSELAWPQAYSKDEVRLLLKRVRDLGMEPIPMFNHWGHATGSRIRNGRHVVLDQNPLLAPLFEPDGWTWCLTNPESLKILAGIRKELIELFGDINYFHLGCDEAYSHAICDSCRKYDSPKLFAEYLNSINDDLKSQGIRPFIWGDALLDNSKWNGYIAFSRPDQRTHEAMDLLSRDFIIADWQYDLQDKNKNATIKHFIEHGFDVVTAPWHDSPNINALGEIAIEQNAFGMMLTTWHTLPTTLGIITCAGSVMWGGENAGKDNPQYGSSYQGTSQATFLRNIRRGPTDFVNAGWRSCEVSDLNE